MFNRGFKSILLAGAAGSAMAATGGAAAAATGTAAGTSIANTATVSYTVGGAAQTGQSNTTSFVVDRKVNLTVAEVGGTATHAALGAHDQVTSFTVTNLTNAVQDFRLAADQQVVSVPLLGTDDFDVANVRVVVDANGNGVYDPGVDTRDYVDELAPDASVTAFIVADVPAAAGENTAIVSLIAVAAAGGQPGTLGADLVATPLTTADTAGTVDIVFADGGGPGDLPRNGIARAFDAYQVDSAAVSLTKSATVVSDPLNLAVNPKAIPGATVRYCIVVTNAGAGPATNVAVADALPANTTYVANSLTVGGLGAGDACVLNGTVEDDDAIGADESDPYGGSFDGTTVRAVLPQVLPAVPLALSFLVTLN